MSETDSRNRGKKTSILWISFIETFERSLNKWVNGLGIFGLGAEQSRDRIENVPPISNRKAHLAVPRLTHTVLGEG